MTSPVARIADAHHHLWNLTVNRYPWLQGEQVDPKDPSGVGMLQRDYLPEDYVADTSGLPVVASVHVEAAHDATDPVRETLWLQAQHEKSGIPTVIVAAARLENSNIQSLLESHLASTAVRGIRQMLDRDLDTGATGETQLMGDLSWRKGFALLSKFDLSFDLQVLPSQLRTAAQLARTFEDTVVVLNHGGYHVPRSLEQDQVWHAGLSDLSNCQNVVVKVSGYDVVDPTWETKGYTSYVHRLIEAFGVERVLFGSNFPVDRRTTTYGSLVDATSEACKELSENERDLLFYGNTMRVYRINEKLIKAVSVRK